MKKKLLDIRTESVDSTRTNEKVSNRQILRNDEASALFADIIHRRISGSTMNRLFLTFTRSDVQDAQNSPYYGSMVRLGGFDFTADSNGCPNDTLSAMQYGYTRFGHQRGGLTRDCSIRRHNTHIDCPTRGLVSTQRCE